MLQCPSYVIRTEWPHDGACHTHWSVAPHTNDVTERHPRLSSTMLCFTRAIPTTSHYSCAATPSTYTWVESISRVDECCTFSGRGYISTTVMDFNFRTHARNTPRHIQASEWWVSDTLGRYYLSLLYVLLMEYDHKFILLY